jgi:hypothetical protein
VKPERFSKAELTGFEFAKAEDVAPNAKAKTKDLSKNFIAFPFALI